MINADFWKNKKILVTGHTGFVGAWLTMVLRFFEADVIGFSLQEEPASLYAKIKESLNIQSFYGDLRDASQIELIVDSVRPDIVFHLAAFGFVKECYVDPVRAYSTNVGGTLNLMHAINETNTPCRIIVASSDKVYDNVDAEMYLFNEGDPLGGIDPYSSSKTCEDILARSYYDTYLKEKCSVTIVRPSNILGGGDHNINRLIPSIYYDLSNDGELSIRNPNSIRPWQNIFDVVDAYLTVAEYSKGGCNIYNVGPKPDGIKSVGDIATYVSKLYNGDLVISSQKEEGVKEKTYLGLSIDRIKSDIGWEPTRSLEQTLDEIYEFYEADDGYNTYELCMKQIREYYSQLEGIV